jgi:phage/plasmid-like protein (TIGR03299 family)
MTALTAAARIAAIRAESKGRVGTPAWRVNPNFVNIDPTIDKVEDVISAAKLDWDVTKEPLALTDGTVFPDKFALTRTMEVYDDKTQTMNVIKRPLGIVGTNYRPVQNSVKFAWFNEYLATGKVKIESAGVINDGEKVVIVAKMEYPDMEPLPGDAIGKYLMLSDAYDGKNALKVQLFTLRLVCSNGMTRKESTLSRSLRHTKNVNNYFEAAKSQLDHVDQDFSRMMEEFKLLANKPIATDEILKNYVMQVFGFEPKEKDGKVQLSTRSSNIVDGIVLRHDKQKDALEYVKANFENDKNSLPAMRGSYYAAYNAVTEYLNHEYGQNHNNRMDSLLFGTSAGLAKDALQIALAA